MEAVQVYSTFSETAIATTNLNCDNLTVHIPQRKADYRDKARVRFKDIKRAALESCNCRDAKEMKQHLKQLGIKLDLRLTAAWCAIARELQPVIKKLGAAVVSNVVVIEQPPQPVKKIIPPVSDHRPSAFFSDTDAMTWYLNKYSPVTKEC